MEFYISRYSPQQPSIEDESYRECRHPEQLDRHHGVIRAVDGIGLVWFELAAHVGPVRVGRGVIPPTALWGFLELQGV